MLHVARLLVLLAHLAPVAMNRVDPVRKAAAPVLVPENEVDSKDTVRRNRIVKRSILVQTKADISCETIPNTRVLRMHTIKKVNRKIVPTQRNRQMDIRLFAIQTWREERAFQLLSRSK